MKTLLYLIALFSVVSSVAADPSAISGHVRQADGQPVAGAQVALFDVSDLAAGAVAQATTDDAGHFAFARKAWGGSGLPDGFGLGQNYPNPFNPSTIIPYHLPVATPVRLEVFNVLGQHVKTLVEGDRPAGAHTAVWDATDAAGQAVGAGVYIYRLSGGGATSTQKMVLVDGQAGRPAGGWLAARLGGDETDATVYGLTVLGAGLVPYVDPAFRVEGGMGPVEVVLAAPVRAKRLQEEDRLLGDVDRNGRVDMVDALLVAAYVLNVSNTPVGDLDGDGVEDSARTVDLTDLGDVNGDELLNLIDAYLIGVYSINPSDPVLPAGIGERVASASGGTPNKMYWTSERKIQRANLDGSEVEDLITTGFYDPFGDAGIALDVGRGKMYWTHPTHPDKIQRANIDGSEVEDLITELRSPSGIALDVGRGKIYWTEDLGATDRIRRANLDGSEVEVVVKPGGEGPVALGRGKIYWATPSSIQRANLDGSEVEHLITTGVRRPSGIALDVGRGKIYWKDNSYPYKIQRANLDGSEVEDLITESGYEGGLALDVGRGKIYWTNGSNKIQRANLDGSEVEDLITGLDEPNGIALDGLAVSEGAGLDLIVGSPEVSDSLLALGQSFSLRARVRNSSPTGAAATTLRYYRSTDATISTSDTPVGTNEVGELSAWGTSLEAIDLTAPSNTGTYYYGACVESVSGESNTNNNCSTSVRITVSRFDLIVESPSVSDSLLAFGRSFTLRATVRNRSPVRSAATTLRYYRSTDATISTSDTPVGTDAVGELSARGMSRESITLTAPSNTGTYYYGACVESVSGESNTNNNCSTSVRIMVTGSDLIVESPSVSDSLLTFGQSFTLSATVRNRSTIRSAATTLRYYRSTDARIDTSDTSVGTDAVGELSASGTSSESIRLRAPSSMGDYYYGACVEEATWESDSQNNCSDGVRVPVGLVIAPGARRQYTAKFSADISYDPSWQTISYRVVSSNVDSGLLGVSNVDAGITTISSFGFTYGVSEVRFTYNLSVRSSIPLNTTLRARMTYEIVTAIAGSEEFTSRAVATYTVPLIIFVRDSGSAKLTASDAESAMPVQEQDRLPPSSARINLKRFIEQPRNPAP